MRSPRYRPARRLIALAAALILCSALLWACGPFLPNWILGPESLLFEGPTGLFKNEVARLRTGEAPPYPTVQSEDGPWSDTVRADRADLEQALARTPAGTRQEILDAHARLREALGGNGDPTGLTVPAGLPREHTLYLEGALAWHQHRNEVAVRAWETLLRLPADERRFRSTWAAFMLGKAHLQSDADAAVTWFRRTRELAAEGFHDSLGLAASSLGWEARAELDRKRHDKALVLYESQTHTGDATALTSLRLASAKALTAGPEVLAAVARDPQARAIVTAYLVTHDPEAGGAWLEALKAVNVRDAAGADRIAWAAYLNGDFEGAAAWLERSETSPIARWVRARLLLRDGKVDEARPLLAQAATDLPDLGFDLDEAFWRASDDGEVLAAPQRAAGEETVIRLARKDHTGALDGFLRTGYWMDASYVAEQVLTLDELKSYVDATWFAEQAAALPQPKEGEWETQLVGGYVTPPRERLARDIRYLLARRLIREGRQKEAEPYLPPRHQPSYQTLTSALAAARDGKRPAAERARELFRAACVTRHQGMELTGTEVEPDWALEAGSYELAWVAEQRAARRENVILPVTPDELERVRRHQVRPWKRFHYRYRAADLAWEAAKLLPSGDRKAEILATAGNWLGGRDPEAADRFYKELVRTCGSTELGRKADELRWFPEADACF